MRDRIQNAFAGNLIHSSPANAPNTESMSDEAYALQQLASEEYGEALEECVRFPIKVQRFLSLINEKDERLYNVGRECGVLRGRSYRTTMSSWPITS